MYIFFFTFPTNAQYDSEKDAYTEVLITIYLENNYSFEAYVLISQSNTIYLDIESLFKSLGIKCVAKLNTLVGFVDDEQNVYTVNFDKSRIVVGNKSINISNGILSELGVKYIKASLLDEAFGLNFIYNPRTVTAKLKPSFELPFFKSLRYKKARKNISELQVNPVPVDTIIPRTYHLFKLGALDWSVNSSQGANNNANVNIALGTELLFGEANFRVNYNPKVKFDIKNIAYNWRWINNNSKIINQVNLGPVSGPTFSNSSGRIIGASINNVSTTLRKAKGSYTITDMTEPNWTVELYINDVLVDYTQADAAGLYLFKVPIVYGVTTLKLKFYGPLGEERTEERTRNTPYTFINSKQLRYSLTTGIVQDTLNSRFAKVNLNYGITSGLTFAGGLEYMSSNITQPFIPFAKVAYQPFSKMVLNLEYTYQNKLKGLVNFYLWENAFLEVDYTKLKANKNINRFVGQETFSFDFATPFHIKTFKALTKLSFTSTKYEVFNYNQINWITSSYINKLKINLSSNINWASKNTPQMSSNLVLGYRLKNGLLLTALTNYNINQNKFGNLNLNLQMRISNINLAAGLQNNIQSKSTDINLSASYDLPFARIGMNSSYSRNNLFFSEYAQGSVSFSLDKGLLHVGNNSAISKGGVLLYPFLDLNGNSILDSGENKVLISSVKISGAKAVISKRDSIARVFDLNAFTNYTVEFSDTNLDNIAWQFKHKTYKILVDPNQYKQVFIPVVSVGEISGMVYFT